MILGSGVNARRRRRRAAENTAPVTRDAPTSSNTEEPTNFEPAPDTEQNTLSPVSATSPPPKSGAGSGTEKWAEYAASLGIEIPADAGRDQIIELVEASAQYADLENTNEG